MRGDGQEPTALTGSQVEVARLFFALPAATPFLLVGRAALVAAQLTTRPTQDLDFFTQPSVGSVTLARDEFEAAAQRRGGSPRGPGRGRPTHRPTDDDVRGTDPGSR